MRAWTRWLLVGVVVVMGAAVIAGRHGHGSAAAADDAAVLQSRELVAAPDLPGSGAELDGSQGAALAADLATRVPLPAGGNFNGIQWSELDGTIGTAVVHEVVEYNAACQWYRALRDGREVADARRVIADAPKWQGLRGHATGELAAGAAADVAGGGGDVLTGVLHQCDDAHRQEIAYAATHGKAGER